VQTKRGCAEFDKALSGDPARQGAMLSQLICAKNQGDDLIWTDVKPADAILVLRQALTQLHMTRFSPAIARDAALLKVHLLGRLGDAVCYAGDRPAALGPYRAQEAVVRAWLIAIDRHQARQSAIAAPLASGA
jgi:serine/threonine-protein kinase